MDGVVCVLMKVPWRVVGMVGLLEKPQLCPSQFLFVGGHNFWEKGVFIRVS